MVALLLRALLLLPLLQLLLIHPVLPLRLLLGLIVNDRLTVGTKTRDHSRHTVVVSFRLDIFIPKFISHVFSFSVVAKSFSRKDFDLLPTFVVGFGFSLLRNTEVAQ